MSLTVRDPRFALHSFEVETDGAAVSQPLRLALEPAKIITGRVTYSDTGKPVPQPAAYRRGERQRGVAATSRPTAKAGSA